MSGEKTLVRKEKFPCWLKPSCPGKASENVFTYNRAQADGAEAVAVYLVTLPSHVNKVCFWDRLPTSYWKENESSKNLANKSANAFVCFIITQKASLLKLHWGYQI